jgi:hypothetical protein
MLRSEMSKEKGLNPQQEFGADTRQCQDDDNKDDWQKRN